MKQARMRQRYVSAMALAISSLGLASVAAHTLATPLPAAAEECPTVINPMMIGVVTLPSAAPGAVVRPGDTLTGLGYLDTFQGDTMTWKPISIIAWYRDGLLMGEGKTYEVTAADMGGFIQQVAAVSTYPCPSAATIASTPPVTVQAATAVVTRLRVNPVPAGKAPRVQVAVTRPGVSRPAGFVKVTWKGPRSGSTYVEIGQSSGRKLVVTLPWLRPGKIPGRVYLYRLRASGATNDFKACETESRRP